jgi:hypothetical protein
MIFAKSTLISPLPQEARGMGGTQSQIALRFRATVFGAIALATLRRAL